MSLFTSSSREEFRKARQTGRYFFLDGLRGWGALFVVLCHVFADGFPLDTTFSPQLQKLLPFNGQFAVLVFFVVSGFSLSIGYLNTGDRWALLRTSVGRDPRLVIPIFVSCLLVQLAMITGVFDVSAPRDPRFAEFFTFQPTWGHFLQFVFWDAIFDYDHRFSYNPPLWSMSVEFYGSAVVLVLIFLFRSIPRRMVIWASVAIAFVALSPSFNTTLLSLFPAGAIIADLYRRRLIDRIPVWFGIALIAFACIVPFCIQARSFNWALLAACAIVIECIVVPPVRQFLEGRLSRELGRLSFPLYLVHSGVMWIIGLPLIRGAKNDLPSLVGINVLMVVVSIALAYGFAPINRFAVWVSHRLGSFAAALLESLTSRNPQLRDIDHRT